MTYNKVKIAIVGLGKMGLSHLAILNASNAIDVVGVCDTSGIVLEALKQHSPFECYSDYKKMLERVQPQAIVIATPTKLHYEMAKFALQKGIHVFLEKPLCLTLSEGQDLINLARSKKLVTQVGYHNRFIGVFQEVKKLVDAGLLGTLSHFIGESYGPVVLKKKESTWRSNPSEGGGCLMDYASHVIDLIHYVLSPIQRVDGTVLKKIYSTQVEDAVYSTLHLDEDLSGYLSVNWSDETYRKKATLLTLVGARGKLIADAQELKVYMMEDSSNSEYQKGWTIKYITDLTPTVDYNLRGEDFTAQIDYFAKSINEHNIDGVSTFSDAFETDRVVELLKNYPEN